MIIHWEPKQSVGNGQSESGCVPWQQANNALSWNEVSAQE